jgi:flagellar hook-length control protein FliK
VEPPQFRQSLNTALLDSGLLTEHQLVDQEPRANDLKLNLLRLYELAKTLLPQAALRQDRQAAQGQEHAAAGLQSPTAFKRLTELIKQLDGAIARIQTNQLASLPQNDQTSQIWQFELPLLHKDRVDLHQIRIKQEGGGSRMDQGTTWSLTLQMNLQPLGPMRVQLRLQDKALATAIWVERQATMNLLERHMAELQQAFEQADLEVARLQAYQSKIAAPEPVAQATGLVSEKV